MTSGHDDYSHRYISTPAMRLHLLHPDVHQIRKSMSAQTAGAAAGVP